MHVSAMFVFNWVKTVVSFSNAMISSYEFGTQKKTALKKKKFYFQKNYPGKEFLWGYGICTAKVCIAIGLSFRAVLTSHLHTF